MGIIRDDDAEIVLYNPFNGEPFFAYNKNTDKLDAKGKDLENLGSVKTDDLSVTNLGSSAIADSTSLSDNTETKINLATADIDHDNVTVDTANNKLVIVEAGTYQINASVEFGSPTDGSEIRVLSYVNGSSIAKSTSTVGVSGEFPSESLTQTVELSANDEVELFARQTGQASLGITPGASFIEVFKV